MKRGAGGRMKIPQWRAFNVQSYCKIRNGVNKIVKKSLNKIPSCQEGVAVCA